MPLCVHAADHRDVLREIHYLRLDIPTPMVYTLVVIGITPRLAC